MPTTSPYPWLVILGTLLPLMGIAVTAAAAIVTRGHLRWIALALGPALTGIACWWGMPPVMPNGNLLAAALFFGYFALLALYYPALFVAGLTAARRRAPVPAD